FQTHVYGRTPGNLPRPAATITSLDTRALKGLATRKRVRIPLTQDPSVPAMDLLLYLPNGSTGRVPVFLGLNFNGNHTVSNEPDIPLPTGWVPNDAKVGLTNNVASERSRGSAAS